MVAECGHMSALGHHVGSKAAEGLLHAIIVYRIYIIRQSTVRIYCLHMRTRNHKLRGGDHIYDRRGATTRYGSVGLLKVGLWCSG